MKPFALSTTPIKSNPTTNPSSAASTCPMAQPVSAAPSLLESLEARTQDLWILHMALLTEMKELVRTSLAKDQQLQSLRLQASQIQWAWKQNQAQEREMLLRLKELLSTIKPLPPAPSMNLSELKLAVKVLVMKLLEGQQSIFERDHTTIERVVKAHDLLSGLCYAPPYETLAMDELRLVVKALLKRADVTPIIGSIAKLEQLRPPPLQLHLDLGPSKELSHQISRKISQAHEKFCGIVADKNRQIQQLQEQHQSILAHKQALLSELEEARLTQHKAEGDLVASQKIIQSLKQRHEQLLKDHGRETDFLRSQLLSLERGLHTRSGIESELARLKAQNHELEQELRETRLVMEETRSQLEVLKEEKEATPKAKRLRTFDDDKENLVSSLLNSPAPGSPRPLIAFTGIPKRLKLADLVKRLRGEVHLGAEFLPSLTHVVTPIGHQSLKSLAAALAGKWIVPPEWIMASAEAGHWLPEAALGGVRYENNPLKSKSFYATAAFRHQQQSSSLLPTSFLVTMIEKLGRARIVKDPHEAEIILVAEGELPNDPKRMTVQQLLSLIPQPH